MKNTTKDITVTNYYLKRCIENKRKNKFVIKTRKQQELYQQFVIRKMTNLWHYDKLLTLIGFYDKLLKLLTINIDYYIRIIIYVN